MRGKAIGLVALGVGAALVLAHGIERPVRLPHATPPPRVVSAGPVAPREAVRHVARSVPVVAAVQPLGQRTGFQSWVQAAHVSPEQETRVLQLITDAQATYRETRGLAHAVFNESDDRLQARLTPEQQAVQAKAIAEIAHPTSPEAQAQASATMESLLNDARAAGPEEDRALDESWAQLSSASDLAEDTYAAMDEFLDEDQVGAFRLAFPIFADLLDEPRDPSASASP